MTEAELNTLTAYMDWVAESADKSREWRKYYPPPLARDTARKLILKLIAEYRKLSCAGIVQDGARNQA